MSKPSIVSALFRRRRATSERAGADSDARHQQARPAPPYPLGRWRCTRATHQLAEYFTPGETYVAAGKPGSSVVRLDHGKGGAWMPHFLHDCDRFWPNPHELSFEYERAE